MEPVIVLLHSPSVGPLTWRPVADRLTDRGHDVLLPSLLPVAAAPAPYWPTVVGLVRAAVGDSKPDRPVLLVAHSNAGLLVPVVADGLDRPLGGTVFVDAGVPAGEGRPTPVLDDDDLMGTLEELADGDGVLPRWTDWWGDADLAPLFPDEATRAAMTDEQPRLPLAYYQQLLPNPPGWTKQPCGYVLFGPAYDVVARDAAERGWPVEHVAGEHLHQLVDPPAVTDAILSVATKSGALREL